MVPPSAGRLRYAGGVLDNVSYENITIRNSRYPIFISEYYPIEPKTPQEDAATAVSERTPIYKNITLKNIAVTDSQEALTLWCIPELPIQHVHFENVKISAKSAAQIYHVANAEFIISSIKASSGEMLRIYKSVVSGL